MSLLFYYKKLVPGRVWDWLLYTMDLPPDSKTPMIVVMEGSEVHKELNQFMFEVVRPDLN
jgi:hypothetical protein